MLNLKSADIEGFRGTSQKVTLDFGKPMVLLSGGNHQGKSSLLNAIEWCLFGDDCLGDKSGIRERVGTGENAWRLINDDCDKARVTLELETDNGMVIVERTESAKGKKVRQLKVTLSKGATKEDDEAKPELTRILGMSFKDFSALIYQHQETLRDFVVQKPTEQSDIMDRLLGLQQYRNILEGIKKSEVLKVQKKISDEFTAFQKTVEERIKIRQEELSERQKTARAKGLADGDFAESRILKLAGAAAKDIEELAGQTSVKSRPLAVPQTIGAIEGFISAGREESKRLWSRSSDNSRKEQAEKWKMEMTGLRAQYDKPQKDCAVSEKALKEFAQANGSADQLDSRLKKIEDDIAGLDAAIKQSEPKAKLIEEGISVLKATAAKERKNCPLCGREATGLLAHLEKEYQDNVKAQTAELIKKRGELERQKDTLVKLTKDLKRLEQELNEHQSQRQQSVSQISQKLSREISAKDDPQAILAKELKAVEDALARIEAAIVRKQPMIDGINDTLDKIGLIGDVLRAQAKIEEINHITDSKEFANQDKIKDEASQLAAVVDDIDKAIKACKNVEAKDKIQLAQKAINSYFYQLTDNAAFKDLTIRFDDEKGVYTFENNGHKRPVPVLSQGDLNSLALAVFLGLADTAAGDGHLGFVLMDDPSQSLDKQEKTRLANALEAISAQKSVIVATMDAEFSQAIKDTTRAKTVYRLEGWSAQNGPGIVKE